jgi:anti-anti-sigma regulatory factor
MQISFSKHEGRVSVTVMKLTGNLDASNYATVIAKAQDAFDEGARSLLIDLSGVPYVSSAGLMSLHTVALIFAEHPTQSKESSRPASRSVNAQNEKIVRQHVKLLSPQSAVEEVLDVVGLKQFLDIYTDLEAAVQSFGV